MKPMQGLDVAGCVDMIRKLGACCAHVRHAALGRGGGKGMVGGR